MTNFVMCNKKKLVIRKSDIEFLKKSVEDRKLEYFKSELLKILDKQEKEENGEEVSKAFVVQELYKSMTDPLYNCIEKAHREHLVPKQIRAMNQKTGKMYTTTVWVNPNKQNGLKKYTEQDSRGAKTAIGKLKAKIEKCNSPEELMQIVLRNKERFSDKDGKPLPIVYEIKKWIDEKNSSFDDKKVEKKSKKQKQQKVELTEKQKENLEKINDILNKNVETFPVGEFSEENFKRLFENGIDSPIEHIKIGENQYQKLIEKNRQDLIAAMADVMKNPALIMKTNTGAKIYAKTYERENNKKTVISVIVDKGKLHISISTHIEKNKQLSKKMDSILYERTESVHGENASRENTPDNSNIAHNNNAVNKKSTYATDICKSIADLKNYAKEKYNLDVTVKDKVPLEKCLKSFVEIEKMSETFKDLPKFIQKVVYSNPGKSWVGLYDSTSRGEYCLHVGNPEQIKKDVKNMERPFSRGDSVEAVTRHESGHAISEMLSKIYSESFGIKTFDEEFEDWFYNSKELKAQSYRKKYDTFEKFKKEGNEKDHIAAHTGYEIAENHVRIKYHEDSVAKVNKQVIDEALKSLGIDGKRKSKRSEYPGDEELKKYPSLSAMWDISLYAMTNDAECIAEGVADYLTNGEKSQKLSKAIYNVLLKTVGEKGIEILKSFYKFY